MSFGLLYWILMLLWFIFGFWSNWTETPNYRFIGGHILTFILFLLVGWKVFGAPVNP